MPYARELLIRYGGFTVGAGTPYDLHGELRIEDSFERASVSFTVVVADSNEVKFASLCAALERAFRTPWKSLEIWQAQQRFASYSASLGTGLNAVPTIRKPGGEADTGRSRVYEITVEMQRPANNVSTTGLREYAVRATFDPARLATVEISGVVTQIGGSAAYTQYRSIIGSLATTVLGAYTGTFELIAEEEGWNTNATLAPFRRVYSQVGFTQGGQGLSDPDIVQQRLTITPQETSDWDYGGDQARIKTIDVRYSCWFDKTTVADPTTKEATIRSFILEQIETQAIDGLFVIASEEYTYHRDEWRMEAHVTAWTSGSQAYYSRSLTVEDTDDKGVVIIPAWSKNPVEAAVFYGPRVYTRAVTERGVAASTLSVNSVIADIERAFKSFDAAPSLGTSGQGEWIITHRRGHAAPLSMSGTRDGDGAPVSLQATEYEARVEARWLRRYREVTL